MIEVGESVRTVDGKILKVDSFEKDCRNVDCLCFTTGEIYTRELSDEIIVNHSKNIIDLIEVGDIVFIEDFSGYDFIYINDKEMLEALKQDVKDGVRIKSILTKELYQANCYTVERKEKC